MESRVARIERQFNPGDIFNTFFMGDTHLDSPGHDRNGLIRDFKFAEKNKADIVLMGDIFDLITHGDRKRFTPSSNKYGTDTAINEMLEEAIDLFTPYAKSIKVMLCGNHEESAVKFHNFDPTALLVYELNKLPGVNISYLGYEGFVLLYYKYKKGNLAIPYRIKVHHGTGGGAEVTRGTITLDRFMKRTEADCYVSAHTHTKVILPDERQEYLNSMGNVSHRRRIGFITGCYVNPVSHGDTRTPKGRPRPLTVDYGHKKRTLQSQGGIMLQHEIDNTREKDLLTRVIA